MIRYLHEDQTAKDYPIVREYHFDIYRAFSFFGQFNIDVYQERADFILKHFLMKVSVRNQMIDKFKFFYNKIVTI
jgi:hypothetical protein